ncbi:MAG TPA: DUF2025 family protein [Pseudomonas sp.]|nr:DUF2025 family protein [Pseudomonas sp.]
MSTTSATICEAADRLKGFVGYNRKTRQYIVRFSEDSFGMDVADASITPSCEFVWCQLEKDLMILKRERLRILFDQHIDDRLSIEAPLRVYLQRLDLPEITARRQLK